MNPTLREPLQPEPAALRVSAFVLASLAAHVAAAVLLIALRVEAPPDLQITFEPIEGVQLAGLGQSGGEAERREAVADDAASAPPADQGPPVPAPDFGPPLPPEADLSGDGVVLAPPKPKPKPKPKPVVVVEPPVEEAKASEPVPPEPEDTTPRPAYAAEVPFEVREAPHIASVAPGNAILTALVDLKAMRRSQHRKSLEGLVKVLPDYTRIAGASGMDPVEVFDTLLVTSADLSVLSENLLIAQSRLPDDTIKQRLDAATMETLRWKNVQGTEVARPEAIWWVKREDPRLFALPEPGLLAFTKPELLPWLRERAQAHRKAKTPFFPPMPAAAGEGEGLPAVAVIELTRFKVSGGPPGLEGVQMVIHDDARPLVRVRLDFADKAGADGFLKTWPEKQREAAGQLIVLISGFSSLISRIKHTRDGDDAVYLEVRVEAREVIKGSTLLANLIQNHTRHLAPRPGDLPAPDAGPDAEADEGGPDGAMVDLPYDKPGSASAPGSASGVAPDAPPAESGSAAGERPPGLPSPEEVRRLLRELGPRVQTPDAGASGEQ